MIIKINDREDRIIPITCTYSHLIEIEKLYPIQGNLKNKKGLT